MPMMGYVNIGTGIHKGQSVIPAQIALELELYVILNHLT